MHIEYFRTAAADIKNSPGWLGKLCLLTLLLAIPVFGIIVVTGYLYGWARDIAWGTKNPLPPRIFGNEDGKLYERGLYICVFMFVCALIPQIFTFAAMLVSGTGVAVTSAAGSSANYGE
ncbi:MAG: DUF4013 domain-containing protein, partial [Coriobacteriaceae bacterium]|nr:DUF4013 domain-containing protein [Coriobacteriaceae bacterium]